MKAIIFAFLALAALANARLNGCQKPNEPFGQCPEVDGKFPVYLMDVNERSVFYECNSGMPVRQSCPKGLVFNPRLNVCDYPSSEEKPYGPVGKCPARDGFFLTYLRDGANVSVFYVCNRGETIMYQCEDGLVFSPMYNACFRI